MRINTILVSAVTGVALAFAAGLTSPPSAYAQSTTTGAIQGRVKDKTTGEPIAGVAVVATGAQGQGAPSALTDENGFYKIDNLTPGMYLIKFFYASVTISREGITVGVNKTVPVFIEMNTDDAGETVHITGSAPTIDPTSTTQGITLDQEYTKNIPLPGRTFEAALGAAAGSQNDGVGVSFSGSSSLENQYYVDGVNTTGLTYGTVGTPLLNNFIQEIEVITGGYDAEYGRATGGIVNVVTKSGTNEVKGSVFTVLTPGAVSAGVTRSLTQKSAIEVTPNLAYNYDVGFEVGGPIIKDKLWYYVGFAPTFVRRDWTRRVNRRTDCYAIQGDGTLSGCDPRPAAMGGNQDFNPDRDPRTGLYITQTIDESIRQETAQDYQALAKINLALSPEHQGQISGTIDPGNSRSAALLGLPQSTIYDTKYMVSDLSAKWTSKFNDNKTEVEGVVGWHRSAIKSQLADPAGNTIPLQQLVNGDLSHYAGFGGESAAAVAGCTDAGNSDAYPGIINCPDADPYSIGGAGGLVDDLEQRVSAKVSVVERLKALGTHEIKGGVDTEQNTMEKQRLMSGGATVLNYVGSEVDSSRWVQLKAPMDTDPRFDNSCRTPGNGAIGSTTTVQSYQCDYLEGTPGYPGTMVSGNTLNWAAYLRDSWQLQPNLTLNYGLRYEEQRLRYAKELQNTADPITQEQRGTNAMQLTGMVAPRIGVLYDWTKEGRSKIYGHWGRFYESVPMDINDRSFGGEVLYRQLYDLTKPGICGAPTQGEADQNKLRIGGPNGVDCLNQAGNAGEQLYGAGGTLVAPGIKPQYMDEIILGVEYELLEDLKLGISFTDRQLGRVIEDVSTDGAKTYVIANPGEITDGDLSRLQTRIDQTDDMAEKSRLTNEMTLFKGIKVFDPPKRRYDALTFTATRRFSKSLYLQGSYTYSKTVGNYPGLISYDNGQVDPNISSQYDLIELLSNRQGALPQDRPHYIKLDGYYTFDFKQAGMLTVGTRIRALSGTPRNVLAGHYLYGVNESFLLPRGEIGRTDFDHGVDLHLAYKRNLGRGLQLEVFTNLFNVYNRQGEASTDDGYGEYISDNNANPVVGGTYEDLLWIRRVDRSGNDTGQPLIRNKNFGNTTQRYSPLSLQFGMTLTF